MTQTTPCPILHFSFELGKQNWKLTFSDGSKKRMRAEIKAADRKACLEAVAAAKKRFELPENCKVVSCYEAGRDGFWIHRWLLSQQIENTIVDSASIEVNRRRRRAKTDRVDGEKLLLMLLRRMSGDNNVFKVVRVPNAEDEDARRPHRELERLAKERNGHTSRIESLLALHGLCLQPNKYFLANLEKARCWDGSKLPLELKQELIREYEQLELVKTQMREMEQARARRLAALSEGTEDNAQTRMFKLVAHLMRLRGIKDSAWVLVAEFFGWRKFKNRRQVGGLSGLTGTPYNSGESEREQGISKAGNRRVRALMVELAWCWLRYQPNSKISKWYAARYQSGTKRNKRVGIVAVARQLLVALWRYAEFGEVPEGATLK